MTDDELHQALRLIDRTRGRYQYGEAVRLEHAVMLDLLTALADISPLAEAFTDWYDGR